MKTYTPHITYASSKPRVGDPIVRHSDGAHIGDVTSIDKSLVYYAKDGMPVGPLIWCFRDGLNALHTWPSKESGKNAPCPGVTP